MNPNSMIDCMSAANALDNDALDKAIMAEDRRMMVAGEEHSLWRTALDRVQRARIQAGRAIVCAELPAEGGTARFAVGSRVLVTVNAYSAGGTYRGEVVRHEGRDAVIRYRQVNGKYVTRVFEHGVSTLTGGAVEGE